MVVGKKEPTDVKFEATSDLILKKNGRKFQFENQDVFGDKKAPKRRDVFLGNDVRNNFPDNQLPKNAKVEWFGTKYDAQLSFRFGSGGRKIPVYEFFIKSK